MKISLRKKLVPAPTAKGKKYETSKFSIVRKLCQLGVYVLVYVVASLYVIVVIVFMTCT